MANNPAQGQNGKYPRFMLDSGAHEYADESEIFGQYQPVEEPKGHFMPEESWEAVDLQGNGGFKIWTMKTGKDTLSLFGGVFCSAKVPLLLSLYYYYGLKSQRDSLRGKEHA